MTQNNTNDQEIDLSQLFQKIKDSFNYLIDRFFDFILFLKNNIIALSILIIAGITSGLILSKVTKSYEQKIIVSPNFGSIDYLNDKIILFNSKKLDNDSLFFKAIGIKNHKIIGELKIKPIVDIFQFVSEKDKNSNLEMIKLMVENDKINSVIEEEITSKNFKKHLIQFKTKKIVNHDDVVGPLMDYFNDSKYYTQIKDLAREISLNKLRANDSIIVQIDKSINHFNKSGNNSNNLVYLNDNNQIGDLLEQKNKIIDEQATLKLDLIQESETIKEISVIMNALEVEKKFSNYKFILPLIFVLVFILSKGLISFYKSQIRKRNLN